MVVVFRDEQKHEDATLTGKIAKVMTNQGIEPWFPQPQCGVLTTVRISHFSLCSAIEYYTIYIMIVSS
jgi:hypothetical protein